MIAMMNDHDQHIRAERGVQPGASVASTLGGVISTDIGVFTALENHFAMTKSSLTPDKTSTALRRWRAGAAG